MGRLRDREISPAEVPWIDQVRELASSAGFNVRKNLRSNYPDLIVGREVLGLERRYAIEVSMLRDPSKMREELLRFNSLVANNDPTRHFDEGWFVSIHPIPPALLRQKFRHKKTRVFSLIDFKRMLLDIDRHSLPKKSPATRAQTEVGKAISENTAAIILAVSGLSLHLDDKLEALRRERPNSNEAIAVRNKCISDYERMRAELETIRRLIAAFSEGEAQEKTVVQSVTTFRDDLRDWWRRGHDAILNKTFDAGLFLSSVGVLSLMKADLKTGMIVYGTLITGRSIANSMDMMKKKKKLFVDVD